MYPAYFYLILLPIALSFLVRYLDLSKTILKNITNILFAVAIVGCFIIIRMNKKIGRNSLSRNVIVSLLAAFLIYYIFSLNSLSHFGF